MKISVFRSDSGIIKSGRNRINRCDLTVLILAEIGLHTVENAETSGIDGSCRFKGINASARSLTAYKLYIFVIDKMIEGTDGIGATSNAGYNRIRKSAFLFKHLFLYLS